MKVIHQFNPGVEADSEYEAGGLAHLVVGNEGRMLDPRRTPVRIVGIADATGMFTCEVLDFEDRGVRWELPFENVGSFQFRRGSSRASAACVAALEAAVARLVRPLDVACSADERERTLLRLDQLRREARAWLESESTFVRESGAVDLASRRGDPRLWADLKSYLSQRGLWEIEDGFASCYVSNPHAGERVKGHRIVLAELGLCAYQGTIVRDPSTFEAPWTRAARAEHVLARMAFAQEAVGRTLGGDVVLFRGMTGVDAPRPRGASSFVSATFSREVALSMLGPSCNRQDGIVHEQRTPATRIFMTFLETEHMNRQYMEAEAVLVDDPNAPYF